MIELIIELIRLNFEFLFFIFWVAFWLLCFLRFATEPKEPTEKPNTFFSKDKNQIEKFPLSDFFPRLQSTLGDISFYFFLFSFIRVVIRFKFVTNITQAPCIFVS